MSARLSPTETVVRKLIRADGTTVDLARGKSLRELAALIGADTCDTVLLRHMGEPLHVMLVDDVGHMKNLPINALATELYLANCRPGTTHEIRGDVVVVPDFDFA